MAYTAELIAVGTELLLGNIANTDAQDISRALSELGINVYFHTVVGDNPARLREAVVIARGRADIIITTGGLGPTYDDLTKEVLAEAFGKKLIFHEEEAERIRAFFEKRLHKMEMTENNFQQAYLPEGCAVLHNGAGTAPGCAFEAEGTHVIMLPGPPRECRAMLQSGAIPYLKRLSDMEIRSHNIHVFGMGESSVEARLRDYISSMDNPTVAPYAKESEVMLRVTARAKTAGEADEMMAPVIERIRGELGDIVYGVDTESLEKTVVSMLSQRGMTLAAAESCTGGLVAKRVTDVPGASRVFTGGVTAYTNGVKSTVLGIDPALLAEKGAVSEAVARAMAEAARAYLGADLGIGITGVAGPEAQDGIPAGTVYIALAAEGETAVKQLFLFPDRDRTRMFAASSALDMVRRHLSGLPL